MNRFPIALILGLILITIISCGDNSDPVSVTPENNDIQSPRATLVSAFDSATSIIPLSAVSSKAEPVDFNLPDNHGLFGMWRQRVYNDGSFELIPLRSEQAHFNITSMILNCPTCLDIQIDGIPGPGLFDFDITLTNPSGVTGFDVTAIVRASGDIKFLNPDSFTFFFSYPGDTSPNPYAAWATGVSEREFAGTESHSEILSFEKGGLTKFGEIDYLFQASWPANQEEPYEIWDLVADSTLNSDGSNVAELSCRVGDWQGNIDNVTIDLTAIGGSSNASMIFSVDNLWILENISYSPTGQGVGTHDLLVTATSNGVSTYNYMEVEVVSSGPIKQGQFLITHQNLPLSAPDGPTDGMDIAVMGALDGTHVGMVFGADETYHFWSSDYKNGKFGLYHNDTGDPISPFDVPNYHFDFANISIPDTSVDSLFSLSWGECNTSDEILNADSTPQVIARDRIALWSLTGDALKLTANVLVLGADPGPPQTFQVIVKPIEFCSGFREDGLCFMTLVYDSGDDSQFPIVDIMALSPPLDFSDNPDLVSGGFEIGLTDGTGVEEVDRNKIVGVDVDDSGMLPITGGYAGHTTVAVVETGGAGGANTLKIIDADVDSQINYYTTVDLPAVPRDVEILPSAKVGAPANYVLVLCADNLIHLYDYAGNYAGNVGGTPYMTGNALRLDIDDENVAAHVLHEGASGPMVTVYKWDG